MKYAVILGDGMADVPVFELNNKTPLEAANKPNIDFLAKKGVLGLVNSVPSSHSPSSDVANLSILGYDPKIYYTGRSSIEAASIGVQIADDEITYRANLVTVSDEADYQAKTMVDYCADEISTDEAKILIEYINENLKSELISFYVGVSYRHLMVRKGGSNKPKLTPPHDITGQKIHDFIPNDELILDLMKKSYALLNEHPLNMERAKNGLHKANSLWIWGEGTKPSLTSFYEKYELKASVISAVDLIKGIGILTGMNSVDVIGATGNIHTNFEGKANAAIEEFQKGQEFVYIHIEAPDECGHRGEIENKVKSIELIDEKIVKPITDYLKGTNEPFAMMILPDHPTPVKLKTHTRDKVPFLIVTNKDFENQNKDVIYREADAAKSGIVVNEGHTLVGKFIKGEF